MWKNVSQDIESPVAILWFILIAEWLLALEKDMLQLLFYRFPPRLMWWDFSLSTSKFTKRDFMYKLLKLSSLEKLWTKTNKVSKN